MTGREIMLRIGNELLMFLLYLSREKSSDSQISVVIISLPETLVFPLTEADLGLKKTCQQSNVWSSYNTLLWWRDCTSNACHPSIRKVQVLTWVAATIFSTFSTWSGRGTRPYLKKSVRIHGWTRALMKIYTFLLQVVQRGVSSL